MNPSKVLRKISQFNTHPHNTPESMLTTNTTPLFDILSDNSPIDTTALHSAISALNDLVQLKQSLHTPAHKSIPQLATTAEWLLAENAILRLELKKSQDMLGARKVWEKGNQLVLNGKIVISMEEILKVIEEAEVATAAKKKRTGRPWGRPKKDALVLVVTLEDGADSEEGSECGEDGHDDS
jgi:regulator of replication initiation timing